MIIYEIYTDGSYRSSKDHMGLGIVWLKNGEIVKKYSRCITGGTNNIAELSAIWLALKSITKPINYLTIYSDSEYAIGVISKNWMCKKNKRLIKTIKEELARAQKLVLEKIEFKHVKGHADNKYNQICDTLATTASLYDPD